ncbi:hypothetical protein STENM327S_06637 [Streptomyces tendae]
MSGTQLETTEVSEGHPHLTPYGGYDSYGPYAYGGYGPYAYGGYDAYA